MTTLFAPQKESKKASRGFREAFCFLKNRLFGLFSCVGSLVLYGWIIDLGMSYLTAEISCSRNKDKTDQRKNKKNSGNFARV